MNRSGGREPDPTASRGRRQGSRVSEPFRKIRNEPIRQLRISLVLLIVLAAVGTIGYALLDDRYSAIDALYMTIITLTTTGFREVYPLSPAGKIFTIGLIVVGVGIAAWAVSNAAEVMLGEAFWSSFQRRRIREAVMRLSDHYVVCGYGRLGRQIARDLEARGEAFVVIDIEPDVLADLTERNVPNLAADATQEDVLAQAGVERARGLVSCLDSDANNVLTILTAREMNPRLLIVARANTEAAESKLRRAGADRMVTPEAIGGHRLALALLRPAVHDFFSRVFSFGVDADVDIGQITIAADSPFAGQTIDNCDLRRLRGVSILAIRTDRGTFDLNPETDRAIEKGETLILIGSAGAIYELEAMYGVEVA
jgi:voltage-gated potassium channel